MSMQRAVSHLSPCDIVLVEGYKSSAIPKLEVWRASVGKPLLHPIDAHIVAIATDHPAALPVKGRATALPVFTLDDYDNIATLVSSKAALLASK